MYRNVSVCVCDLRTVGSFNSCFCCKNITCPASLSLSLAPPTHLRLPHARVARVSVWVYVTVMCHHPLSLSRILHFCVLCLYFYCECGAKKPTDNATEWEGGKGDAWARQVAILNFFAFVYATLLHITQVAAKFIAFYCAFRQFRHLLLSLCCCFFYYLLSIYYALVRSLLATVCVFEEGYLVRDCA